MTKAETILAMIEKVDPAYTAGLDEIDFAVMVYHARLNKKYALLETEKYKPPCYTRSRDALKGIRPKGWLPWSSNRHMPEIRDRPTPFFAGLTQGPATPAMKRWQVQSSNLPTEELAELHAIIQAHAHDRSLADKREGV